MQRKDPHEQQQQPSNHGALSFLRVKFGIFDHIILHNKNIYLAVMNRIAAVFPLLVGSVIAVSPQLHTGDTSVVRNSNDITQLHLFFGSLTVFSLLGFPCFPFTTTTSQCKHASPSVGSRHAQFNIYTPTSPWLTRSSLLKFYIIFFSIFFFPSLH